MSQTPQSLPAALTPDQIRLGYFEAIKMYTNNFHDILRIEDAPLTIRIAVDKMHKFMRRDGSIQSESISDLSLTFKDIDGLPRDILSLIAPWCKLRF